MKVGSESRGPPRQEVTGEPRVALASLPGRCRLCRRGGGQRRLRKPRAPQCSAGVETGLLTHGGGARQNHAPLGTQSRSGKEKTGRR